jgi:hypothetical protein
MTTSVPSEVSGVQALLFDLGGVVISIDFWSRLPSLGCGRRV